MLRTKLKITRNSQLLVVQLAIILLTSTNSANGAKILFVIGASSHSHRVAIQPLAERLAEIGHDVTFLSPIKPEVNNPKIKEVCPKGLLDINDQLHKEYSNEPVISRMKDKTSDPFFEGYGAVLWEMNYAFNEATLKSPDFKDWVENSKFDLVIKEQYGNEFSLALAHKHGAKVIGFYPSPIFPSDPDLFGFPTETTGLTGWFLGSPYRFIPGHFYTEFKVLLWHLYQKYVYIPKVEQLLKETFSDDLPPLEDMIKTPSILLVNTHFSSEYARSLPPYVVQVGGMHVKDSKSRKPLPKNINDFVEAPGTDGFIYISFGSILRISALPSKMRKDLFDAIRSFKNARFLIKWNDDIPADMPENALPLKWFPQQDLLAHPKCRGFISQGGLMSFQQATYNGVPVVIVPVFGDQPFNSETAVHQGNGIHLELQDITLETFSEALSQLLYNETLATEAKEVARRFKDRPMTSVETAVWWTEYVLRHNDTSHLKPLGINQQWWERRLLDFWATVFTGILLSVVLCVLAISSLIRFFLKNNSRSQDKLKKH